MNNELMFSSKTDMWATPTNDWLYYGDGMKNKLRVAVSPLTNTIFAGKTLKAGAWAMGKQDVTMDCLNAVAEHVKNFGKPVEVTDAESGKLIYKITVQFE